MWMRSYVVCKRNAQVDTSVDNYSKAVFLYMQELFLVQLHINHNNGLYCIMPYTAIHWPAFVSAIKISPNFWEPASLKHSVAQEYHANPPVVVDPCNCVIM